MILDRHLVTITGPGGLALQLVENASSSVILDSSWAPYARAQLVIAPLTPAQYATLDPRLDTAEAGYAIKTPPRVQISYSRVFTSSPMLDELDAGTGPIDSLNYGGSGITLDTLGVNPIPLNPTAPVDGGYRSFDLAITGRNRRADGTITLTLESDEVLAQDDVSVLTADYVPAVTTLRALVASVLGRVRVGSVASLGTFDPALRGGAPTAWKPGATAWEYLQPIIESYGARVWCDENRIWHLSDAFLTDGISINIDHLVNMTDWADETSRDGDWADAIMLVYTYTDAAGARQTSYDIDAPARRSRTRVIRYDNTVFPGAGAAASIRRVAQLRGRSIPLRAISIPTASPGNLVIAPLPTGETLQGLARSITFDLDTFEMSVTTRDPEVI